MELEVKEIKRIDEGKHIGVIISVERNNESKYDYLDVWIEAGEYRVKAGYNASIVIDGKDKKPRSELAKLLNRFGLELKAGEKVDPMKSLIGKKCGFVTIDENKNGNTYSNVKRDSVKPVKVKKR